MFLLPVFPASRYLWVSKILGLRDLRYWPPYTFKLDSFIYSRVLLSFSASSPPSWSFSPRLGGAWLKRCFVKTFLVYCSLLLFCNSSQSFSNFCVKRYSGNASGYCNPFLGDEAFIRSLVLAYFNAACTRSSLCRGLIPLGLRGGDRRSTTSLYFLWFWEACKNPRGEGQFK